MTPVRLLPRIRIPWYAAFAVYAVSYVAWAAARGWDFTPSAFWVITGLVLGSLYGSRSWLVKDIARDEAEEAAEEADNADTIEPAETSPPQPSPRAAPSRSEPTGPGT